MRRRRLRTAMLVSVGAVAMLLLGQGIAVASEGSATIEDPITDTIDDTTDPITDTVKDTTDPITDTVKDTTDPITDTVKDTTDPITDTVKDTTDPITDTVKDTTDPITGAVGGTTDGVAGTATTGAGSGTLGTTDGSGGSSAQRDSPRSSEDGGPLSARASFRGGSDLDELAEGGNSVVDPGDASNACVGSAQVVCLDLVGGLGSIGILYRAAEEARDVLSAFVDGLASTGADLLGSFVMLTLLTLAGVVLVSREHRSGAAPSGNRRPPVRT
jgi:gas vesicle protein